MKQYKIVKHYVDPEAFIYRIYKRQYVFFWSHLASRSSIEGCESYIAQELLEAEVERNHLHNTPADKTLMYL